MGGIIVNMGLAATLNRCLKLAKGEYIARMDDDDISLPDRFEKQVLFLENNPDYAIVGGAIRLYDEKGPYGIRYSEKYPDKKRIFLGSSFEHPTVMIRKDALVKANGYTISTYTRRAEDYDLWNKLYYMGYKGANLQEVVLYYFESISSYKKRKFKHRLDLIVLSNIWRKKLKIPYNIFLFKMIKTFASGLIPNRIMYKYHRFKFRENNSIYIN